MSGLYTDIYYPDTDTVPSTDTPDTEPGSEEDSSAAAYSPVAGCRVTNSFDRFPFMSRPLHSTMGTSRPASNIIYSGGEDTMVKQSASNPNVLFCTPEDMKVLRYDKLR